MDFQSQKSFGKLRLRAFQPYHQTLCILKHVKDVKDNRKCAQKFALNNFFRKLKSATANQIYSQTEHTTLMNKFNVSMSLVSWAL